MKCKIDGCYREAKYKREQVCQTHYHRMWRTGTYSLIEKNHKQRVITPNNYVRVYDPEHKLAIGSYVFEHRKIVYDKYGENLPPCELCGKHITWENTLVDHIDCDTLNNNPDNLRPLCRACNTFRSDKRKPYEINGKRYSLRELAEIEEAQVSYGQIANRLKTGMDVYSAVFGKAKTHKK